MGKRRKLRSSVKILHEALTSFTPAVARGPFSIQPDKTHSSSGLIPGFNSTPPSFASSNYGRPSSHDSLFLLLQNRGHVEEEAVSISAAKSSTSTCSSRLSSSSSSSLLPAATGGSDHPADAEFFPSGTISSTRFFFSPCSSKSIATREDGEAVGFSDVEHSSCHNNTTPSPGGTEKLAGEGGDVQVLDTFAETRAETSIAEWTRAESSGIFLGSTPTAMASRDPYGDFRSSMEEMVMANGLWDWASLKELLQCYLRLNEKTTHGLIVLAFLDLLMQLPLHPGP